MNKLIMILFFSMSYAIDMGSIGDIDVARKMKKDESKYMTIKAFLSEVPAYGIDRPSKKEKEKIEKTYKLYINWGIAMSAYTFGIDEENAEKLKELLPPSKFNDEFKDVLVKVSGNVTLKRAGGGDTGSGIYEIKIEKIHSVEFVSKKCEKLMPSENEFWDLHLGVSFNNIEEIKYAIRRCKVQINKAHKARNYLSKIKIDDRKMKIIKGINKDIQIETSSQEKRILYMENSFKERKTEFEKVLQKSKRGKEMVISGYLYQDSEKNARLGLLYIEMPPLIHYHVSKSVNDKLKSLTNKGIIAEHFTYQDWLYNRVTIEELPRIIVWLKAKVEVKEKKIFPHGYEWISYFIKDAELLKVEFISQDWLKCLKELCSVSGIFPSPDGWDGVEFTKKKFQKISVLLNKMRNLKPTKKQTELVRKINSDAKITRYWQRHFENDYIYQVLILNEKLKIVPKLKLPMDEKIKRMWKEHQEYMYKKKKYR